MGKREVSERQKKGCSQDIADTSGKTQALTESDLEVTSLGFTAIDSGADKNESASLMFAISIVLPTAIEQESESNETAIPDYRCRRLFNQWRRFWWRHLQFSQRNLGPDE